MKTLLYKLNLMPCSHLALTCVLGDGIASGQSRRIAVHTWRYLGIVSKCLWSDFIHRFQRKAKLSNAKSCGLLRKCTNERALADRVTVGQPTHVGIYQVSPWCPADRLWSGISLPASLQKVNRAPHAGITSLSRCVSRCVSRQAHGLALLRKQKCFKNYNASTCYSSCSDQ